MKFIFFLFRLIFVVFFGYLFYFFILKFFEPIFSSTSLIFPYAVHPFDICKTIPTAWFYIKFSFKFILIFNLIFLLNSFFTALFSLKFSNKIKNKKNIKKPKPSEINLLIGKDFNKNTPIYIKEKGLYQNILITGTIGSGKTSSAMYPFCKQLIEYSSNNIFKKIGMLILDVKGNFYKQILEYAKNSKRLDDVIVIELNGKYKYNPLHKPNLAPQVLAHRLKTILLLFSPNNSESYWIDEAEKVLTESIKLCRLYNNGYVTFKEIHKLITMPNYYNQKIELLQDLFRLGKFSKNDVYNLHSALVFFQEEFIKLDPRVLSILKSEITRITSTFLSNYDVLNTFSPDEKDLNFLGFDELIKEGKIVVLNMNISEYENLSKIIAAYLKLDFQSEVLSKLSKGGEINPTAFICDEYHEYVTLTDANFFAQSREAKCINIVTTQSYTSLLNTLDNQNTTKAIIQNLVNKFWFRTDDIFTIEDAQKQLGKEEKTKISKTISENAKTTNFNIITQKFNSLDSNLSESINSYSQFDFIYDTNFFTQKLETFSCLAFISTGNSILPPQKIQMIPYFKNTN